MAKGDFYRVTNYPQQQQAGHRQSSLTLNRKYHQSSNKFSASSHPQGRLAQRHNAGHGTGRGTHNQTINHKQRRPQSTTFNIATQTLTQ
jgi:hypothetical protein